MLYYIPSYLRRDGRVVEGAALEMLYRGNSIVGSNPTLSAIFILKKEAEKGKRDSEVMQGRDDKPVSFVKRFFRRTGDRTITP